MGRARGHDARPTVIVARVSRPITRVVLGLAACASLALPPSADAALVGPHDLSDSIVDGSYGCFGFPSCTFTNLSLPGAAVRSPISGTITRWRVNVEATSPNTGGPLRLQVLRRTVNEPGVAADKFKALRQSGDAVTGPGKNVLQASLDIRKGDFIGLADLSDQTFIRNVDGSGLFGVFDPPLAPGGPGSTPDEFPTGGAYLLFNATVKG